MHCGCFDVRALREERGIVLSGMDDGEAEDGIDEKMEEWKVIG